MLLALLLFAGLAAGWFARDVTRYLFRPAHRRPPTPPRHARRPTWRHSSGHPVPDHLDEDDVHPDVHAALEALDPCRSAP